MSAIRKYVGVLTNNIVLNGNEIESKLKQGNWRHFGIVRFDDKGSDVFHAETPR
jgi:hypothetical protein